MKLKVIKISLLLLSVILVSSCALFEQLFNPLIGTWKYSESDTVYDSYAGEYVSVYAEETLDIQSEGIIIVTGLARNNSTGVQLDYAGSGTYSYDKTYFSCTITLDRNDLNPLVDTVTLNGTYSIDGNKLRIDFDDGGASDYYKQ